MKEKGQPKLVITSSIRGNSFFFAGDALAGIATSGFLGSKVVDAIYSNQQIVCSL
jgi:hypothetical protein